MAIKTEKESRANLISWAQRMGCEGQLLKIFARYDDLLKGARTPAEYEAIATLGINEIHTFFNGFSYGRKVDKHGTLMINGKTIKK